MKKILIARELAPQLLMQVRQNAAGWDVEATAAEEEMFNHLRDAEVLVGWPDTPRAVDLAADAPQLRWVQSWSAGIDNFPLSVMRERGIWLTTGSGVHPKPVSETALALALSLCRGMGLAAPAAAQHRWLPDEETQTVVFEMHDKTAAILGVGAIGQELAHLCKAFGMRVLGLSFSGRSKQDVDEMFTPARLPDVLAQSDVVFNILPLTPETKGLMGKQQFETMKNSAVYISVGRGPSTDTDALVAALNSGEILGAGLDVTDPEPLPENHPLWDAHNVVILPHVGGMNPEYATRLIEIFIKNLQAYEKEGKPGHGLVDFEKAY